MQISGTQNVAQLHLWDTLGQERFKALAPVFFRRSIAAFLVYDVTDRDSFLALESWHEQIKNNSEEDIVVMLVGNKVDKPDKVIQHEMGQEYAREKGWGFIEVSAKEDINIKTAFTTLVSNIFQIKARDQITPNNQLPIGENRTESISLHKKDQKSTTNLKDGKKKKKDGGCCK